MKERGSVFSGLTIAVLIVLVIGGITMTALFSTADKVDNKIKESAQTAATNFVTEACNKGNVKEEDFNKMIQEITTGLATVSSEIEIYQGGESQEKKTDLTTTKRIGDNEVTIYYTSQVQERWKNTGGSFVLNEGDQVSVRVYTSSSALEQNGDKETKIAEATGTCSVNGKK